MNMALDEGCLFGITRPNGLEETDIGQDVSKVFEVHLKIQYVKLFQF
jgi:hypothetical protein